MVLKLTLAAHQIINQTSTIAAAYLDSSRRVLRLLDQIHMHQVFRS